MFRRLVLQIIAGTLGIWLADRFISGVSVQIIPGQSSFLGIQIAENWQIFILLGLVLGLINFFIKPILKIVSLPLRLLTFGSFSLVINIGLVWLVDIIFPELKIIGIIPLLWTTALVWLLNFILGIYLPQKK